jgi:hypothetical protein
VEHAREHRGLLGHKLQHHLPVGVLDAQPLRRGLVFGKPLEGGPRVLHDDGAVPFRADPPDVVDVAVPRELYLQGAVGREEAQRTHVWNERSIVDLQTGREYR